MKKVLSIIYAIIILGAIGCQEEESFQIDSVVNHKRTIRMETTIDMYDQTTRSSGNTIKWENGTKLFLNFSNNGTPITGVAEYDANEDIWILTYSGNLDLANKVEVAVYYFTEYEIDPSGKNVLLSHKSAIYSDTDGVYSFLSDGELRIVAHLTPAIGRVRFKGNVGDYGCMCSLDVYMVFNVCNLPDSAENSHSLCFIIVPNVNIHFFFAVAPLFHTFVRSYL